MRSPVAISAVGVAGTAGAVAAVISLSAGASNAFAGWSAKPTPPGPAQLATAAADCAQHSPITGLPLVLSDTRGPFTFEVYANDSQSAICTSGPSFSSVAGQSSSRPVTVPTDGIDASVAQTANRAGQAYSFADGRAGAEVSAITLVLDDGSDVTATVQHGWFVAWWPGAESAKSAELATPSGVRTQTLPDRSPCAPNACTGGPHGSGGGPVTSSSSSFGSGDGGGEASGSYRGGQVTSSFRTSQP